MNKRKMKGTLLIAVFIISTLAIAIPLASAVEPSYPPPEIDGVIGEGEWDGALEIDVASSMGTVKVLATKDYLYMLFELVDSTDAREGQQAGNDKTSININPTDANLPYGKPYDIIFETGTDPAAWQMPTCGQTDGYETNWVVNGFQEPLPDDLLTKTIFYGTGRRIVEWKIPLAAIAPSPEDTLKLGGNCDIDIVGSGASSYRFPPTLEWAIESTYVDYSYNVLNENTGFYYHTMALAVAGSLATDKLTTSVIDGTVPVGDMGTVTVGGTGTITTYECDEPGTGFGSSTGDYFDVKVPDVSGVTFIDIVYKYEDDDIPLGLPEEDLRIWWFDDPDWVICSDQSIDTEANTITVHIDDSTSPSLDDMTGTPFGLGSTINLSPLNGPVGTEVEVSGDDATPFGKVETYWENVGGAKLDEGYADNEGIYSMDITIPEDFAGAHWVVVKDVSSGTTIGAEFNIEPKIVLKPTSGLPGDGVIVTGTGYAADEEIEIFFSATDVTPDPAPETDLLGSFEATIIVPDKGYAIYDVTAGDGINTATAPFEMTATITLEPEEVSSGTLVDISGIGFSDAPLAKVNVYFDLDDDQYDDILITPDPDDLLLLEDVSLDEGIFTESFIVPTVDNAPPEGDLYRVFATDGFVIAYFDLNVTATTQITMTPVAGSPSLDVIIEGGGFTADADVEVTVDFGPLLDYETFLTNSTGGFKGTLTVPTLPEDTYTIKAKDENGLEDTTDFTIAVTAVILDKSEGPTGTQVKVTGYGFTDVATANVTFGDTVVLQDIDVDPELEIGTTFTVPTVPVGTYTITVEDSVGLINIASFEVNATTMLILTPELAPTDYVVSIDANYFTAVEGIAVPDWYIYNGTWSEILAVSVGTTNATGGLTGTFTVPEIDAGDYSINATDANKLFAETSFTIIPPYIEIETIKSEYQPEEMVKFYVNSTYYFNLNIAIRDPIDFLYTTIEIETDDWMAIEDYWVIPYAAFFELPFDAATGAWNWTAIDTSVSEEVANGTFTVGEVVEPQPELPAETTGEETLDSTGAPKTSFALGETVQAYSDITNVGTESQTMLIVVQFKDPAYRVFAPVFLTITLAPEQSFGYAPGLIIPPTGYTTGTWTAKIMVFDAWPALGGVPIGLPVTLSFTVTS